MKNPSLEIIKLLNDDAAQIVETASINKLIKKALKLSNEQAKLHKFVEFGKYDNNLHFTTKQNYVTYDLILSAMLPDEFLTGADKKFVGIFSTTVEDKLTTYSYNLIFNNGSVEIETIITVDSLENANLHYEPKQVSTTVLTDQEVSNIFGANLTV